MDGSSGKGGEVGRGDFGGGSGDGLRGPIGRRSDEFRERLLGDRGSSVIVHWLLESLAVEARDAGRAE